MSIKRVVKYLVVAIVSLVILAVVAVGGYCYIAGRQIASRRAIHSADGIETLERVAIGGIDQWMEIRGQSVRNPILLFIHGGPGSAFMPMARAFQDPWEKYFTVVQWDQRGAGKTYSSNSKEVQRKTINMARMNTDTLEVVNYLRKRFGREKIFVLGHSWGSVLGLYLAHEHPELLYAYIGVGQATDGMRNEESLYADTLAEARRTQNKKALDELASIAPYPSANVTFHQIRVMREWSGTLIGPTAAAANAGDEALMSPKAVFVAPEYSLMNSVDWFRGQLFSVDLLLPALTKMKLSELGYDYCVPILFLEGRHDPYTPSSVAKEFFDKVNDGQKEFVWFEESGHFPFVEEPGKFMEILTQKVLPEAQGAQAAR